MDSLRGEVDPFLLRSNPAVLTVPMFDPTHPPVRRIRGRYAPRRNHAVKGV
jgi:hypothetical protein